MNKNVNGYFLDVVCGARRNLRPILKHRTKLHSHCVWHSMDMKFQPIYTGKVIAVPDHRNIFLSFLPHLLRRHSEPFFKDMVKITGVFISNRKSDLPDGQGALF